MSVPPPAPSSGSSAPTRWAVGRPDLFRSGVPFLRPGGARRVWPPLLVGVLGSLLVTLGSYSVGWLASVSPLNRAQWLIPWRTQEAGVFTGIAVLTLGLWLMVWAWLRLAQVRDPREPASVRVVTAAAALWSLPQLAALPIISRDMFAYVAQGRMMEAGKDPYRDSIADVANWLQLGADSMWAYDGTPYGPVFLWIEQSVVALTGDANPDPAIFLFRLVAVVGVVLTAVFVPLICRHTHVPAGWAQWLTVANPLFLVHFVASGHNDSLMVGLALAGTWCALQAGTEQTPRTTLERTAWGLAAVVLVTLSLGIKPITVVLLPFIGLLWAGPRAGWLRRFLFWGITALTAAALMALIGLLNGFGFGWLAVMAGTGTGVSPWAPVGALSLLTVAVLELMGQSADLETVSAPFKLVGRVLSVLIVLALMFRGRQDRVLPRMMWAFTALVALSPVVQPWYLLWLLPFFAVVGIRDDWQLTWTVFTVCFFLVYGAQDQLFTWPFLGISLQVRLVSLAVSAVCLVWIFALDPSTRHVLRGRLPRRGARRSAAAPTDDARRT